MTLAVSSRKRFPRVRLVLSFLNLSLAVASMPSMAILIILHARPETTQVTRYASAYHRRVFIDMFFQQWDDDKYQNLALMLLNNYRQALSIIKDEGAAVEKTMATMGITSADLELWHAEQAGFFETIGEESRWDVHAVAYVELFQELSSSEYVHFLCVYKYC